MSEAYIIGNWGRGSVSNNLIWKYITGARGWEKKKDERDITSAGVWRRAKEVKARDRKAACREVKQARESGWEVGWESPNKKKGPFLYPGWMGRWEWHGRMMSGLQTVSQWTSLRFRTCVWHGGDPCTGRSRESALSWHDTPPPALPKKLHLFRPEYWRCVNISQRFCFHFHIREEEIQASIRHCF